VYDPLFNADDEVVDLYAVRHVYPLSGFRLLIAAYTRALRDSSFEPAAFITGYCRERYGLGAGAAMAFRHALFNAPYKVIDEKVVSASGMPLQVLLDSARQSVKVLSTLQPVEHVEEFAHYLLMADIRAYYLTYLVIEARVNDAVSIADFEQLAVEVRTLMATEPGLDEAFGRLNGGTLYPAAIREENAVRVYRTHLLYERLTRAK
jgi:hypothetical protein